MVPITIEFIVKNGDRSFKEDNATFATPEERFLQPLAPLRRSHQGAVLAVQCKHPVETGEVNSRLRHQGRQSGDEAFTVKNALLSLRSRRQKYSGLAEVPESPTIVGLSF